VTPESLTLPAARRALASIRALIDALRALSPSSVHLQRLAVPLWQRTLAELQTISTNREPASDVRIVWKLGEAPFSEHFTLVPVQQKLTKAGLWARGKKLRPRDIMTHPGRTDADLRVVESITDRYNESVSTLPSALLVRALRHVDPQRLVTGETLEPLRVVRITPRLRARLVGDGFVSLRAVLGDREVPLDEAARRARRACDGQPDIRLDNKTATMTILELDVNAARVLEALECGPTRWPVDAYDGLVALAGRLQQTMPLELPTALRGEQVAPREKLVLRIEPEADVLRLHLRALPLGETPLVPGETPAEIVSTVDGQRAWTIRDLDHERAKARALATALDLYDSPCYDWELAWGDETFRVLERIEHRATESPHLALEWSRSALRSAGTIHKSSVRVDVIAKKNWFGIDGGAVVADGQVTLAMLFEAMRRGQRYIRVSSDKFARLSDELVSSLRTMAASTRDESSLELGVAAPVLLADLPNMVGKAAIAQSFAVRVDRIRALRASEPAVPQHLEPVLRPYQRDGYRWLMRLASCDMGAVLADDMGLGKTLQALALLDARAAEGPALVVAPTSVCGNWRDEAVRFAPSLRVNLMHAT
jgi:hypothetical protein